MSRQYAVKLTSQAPVVLSSCELQILSQPFDLCVPDITSVQEAQKILPSESANSPSTCSTIVTAYQNSQHRDQPHIYFPQYLVDIKVGKALQCHGWIFSYRINGGDLLRCCHVRIFDVHYVFFP
jgi:hypothetical protein